MSRYATVIDLHTWKNRHSRRKPKRRKARRKGYASAGMVAGDDPPRRRQRDQDRDDSDAEYEDPDEGLGDWEGDLDADLDADLSDRGPDEDLGDDEPFEPVDGNGDRDRDQDDDVGAFRLGRRRAAPDARRGGPLVRLRSAGERKWGAPASVGPNLQVRSRKGFRAAVVEIKPGLFVVAEVPQTSVEFGFGPLLLGPALARTLSRVFNPSQAGDGAGDGAQRPELPPQRAPRQLPGPTAESDPRVPQWVDGEVAQELGCGPSRKRERA